MQTVFGLAKKDGYDLSDVEDITVEEARVTKGGQ